MKYLREYSKKNQEQFGKILGITKSGVSDIENGRRNVTEQHIIMLKLSSEYCNLNTEWLRYGQGDMFVEPDTISLDDYVRINKLTPLQIELVKQFIQLDADSRETIMNFLKSVFLKSPNIDTQKKYEVNNSNNDEKTHHLTGQIAARGKGLVQVNETTSLTEDELIKELEDCGEKLDF